MELARPKASGGLMNDEPGWEEQSSACMRATPQASE